MKIYLITRDINDSQETIKVYLSKVKAERYCKKINKQQNTVSGELFGFSVEEIEAIE